MALSPAAAGSPADPVSDPVSDPRPAADPLAAFSAALSPHVTPGAPYALLDFPDHSNIGDSAIWAGERRWLDAHVGRPPDYVCSLRTWRRDVDRFCPEGPLLLHGGGNLGDIWPRQQAFRLDVLETCRHRRIVQLAQSAHFRDRAGIDRMARAVARHGRVTLLLRDAESLALARRHFDCESRLCPDAAHQLGPLAAAPPRHRVLSVLRQDPERSADRPVALLARHGPVIDWGRQPLVRTPADRLIERLIAPRRPESGWLMRRRAAMYDRQAAARVARGIRLLSAGATIVSDRLHVHLLAELMGRRHLVLANSYAKTARYIDVWGASERTLQLEDPAALAEVLAAEARAPAASGAAPGPAPIAA